MINHSINLETELKLLLKEICDDSDYIQGVLGLVSRIEHKRKMIYFIKNSKAKPTPDEISFYALILDEENGPSDEYIE